MILDDAPVSVGYHYTKEVPVSVGRPAAPGIISINAVWLGDADILDWLNTHAIETLSAAILKAVDERK
jgi:hypothetical protein